MEFSRIPLRKGVSFAFPGMYMNQYRAVQLLRPGQHIAQAGKIMAVDGAEIGKAHIFKERAAGPDRLFQAGFQPVVKAIQGRFGRCFSEETPVPLFKMVVGRLAPQSGQMIGNRPYIGVDGHTVVVEDHDQMLPGRTGVVQTFIGKAAGQRAVSNQRQYLIILLL